MSDLDYRDRLDGPYVDCRCGDCGATFREPFDAPQTICVECGDARDAHTSALERRLTDVALAQLKVALSSPKKQEGAA